MDKSVMFKQVVYWLLGIIVFAAAAAINHLYPKVFVLTVSTAILVAVTALALSRKA